MKLLIFCAIVKLLHFCAAENLTSLIKSDIGEKIVGGETIEKFVS